MAAELLVDETGPDLLRVVGEIDTHTAPTLAERLADIPPRGTRHRPHRHELHLVRRSRRAARCCRTTRSRWWDRSASSVRVRRWSDCLSCQASPAGCRSPTSSATTTDRPFSVCRRSSALSAATIRSRGPSTRLGPRWRARAPRDPVVGDLDSQGRSLGHHRQVDRRGVGVIDALATSSVTTRSTSTDGGRPLSGRASATPAPRVEATTDRGATEESTRNEAAAMTSRVLPFWTSMKPRAESRPRHDRYAEADALGGT